MLLARVIPLVLFALLFAQVECAAMCAGQWCRADLAKSQPLPPCHRQHGHPHGQAPSPCADQLIAASPATHPVQAGIAVMAVVLLPAAVPLAEHPSLTSVPTDPSPPGFSRLSSVILRL